MNSPTEQLEFNHVRVWWMRGSIVRAMKGLPYAGQRFSYKSLVGIRAGAKAATTGAAIQSGTGHDTMCSEVLTFCEAALPGHLGTVNCCDTCWAFVIGQRLNPWVALRPLDSQPWRRLCRFTSGAAWASPRSRLTS